MKKWICSLLLLLPLALSAQEPTLKVGSYNLCTSDSRKNFVEKGKKDIFADPQRYWTNSATAVADMIAALDCDVLGVQEICDSIWGVKGDKDIRRLVAQRTDAYAWVLYPNTVKGISYDVAIAWKPSVCDTLATGIFWTGGIPDQPKTAEGEPTHTCKPCIWARMRHKTSGREFWFLSTHTVVPQKYQNNTWPKNRGNILNLKQIRNVGGALVPEDIPSILVGDLNVDYKAKDWNYIAESRWLDVLEYLKGAGRLSKDVLSWGTQNLKDESAYSKWYPDHIMLNGFRPLNYHIDRRKFPTVDGTLHYPSDHLPITSEVEFITYGKPIVNPTPARSDKKPGVRVMSFNIRYFNNKDDKENGWDHRKWAIKAMLGDVLPDVMGVQESVPRQNEFLKKYVPGYDYFAASRNGDGTGEFASTFYNTRTVELEDWGYFWLNGEDPSRAIKGWDAQYLRLATWSIFKMKDSGKRFFFVNTHLDHKGVEARKEGLTLIMRKMKELNKKKLPLVLVGDFNTAPEDETLKGIRKEMKCAREVATSSDTRYSFNGFGKTWSGIIDYIWFKGFRKCNDFKVVAEKYENAPFLSDHYPNRADLEF